MKRQGHSSIVYFFRKYGNKLLIVSFPDVIPPIGRAASIAILQFSSNHTQLACVAKFNEIFLRASESTSSRLSAVSQTTLTTANQVSYLQWRGQIGHSLDCEIVKE